MKMVRQKPGWAFAVAVSFLLLTVSAGTAQDPEEGKVRSPVPEGFLLSSNSPVSDPSDENADNVGPPLAVLAGLYAKTGANLTGIRFNWQECEPGPPQDGRHAYTWPDTSKDPFLRIPKLETIASFDLKNQWAEELKKKDKEAYWQYVEAFVEAAAGHARRVYGTRYFRVPGNEPSLTSVARKPVYKPEYPGWNFWYMDRAIHVARAIKRADRRNMVFFGQLVVGDRARIGALAQAGLNENLDLFDVLDIHAYSRDPNVHIDMNQIIESHEVLEEIGADHVRIFLGEGWSSFPLPKELDGNLTNPPAYRPEHVNHYRNCVFSGWYNVMTPRPGEYDPPWVVGANYFTFCDLLEGRGWRKRAVPLRDGSGNIVEYMVDGYRKLENELGPFFRPWGIVDITGKPKGNLHLEFPPYIPKHMFEAEFAAPIPENRVRPQKMYRARATFRNDEDQPMEHVTFEVVGRKKYGQDLRSEPVTSPWKRRIKPGEIAEQEFDVLFPGSRIGKPSRFYAQVEFTWNGKKYFMDAWGPKVAVGF